MDRLFSVEDLSVGVRGRALLEGLAFALAGGERLALEGPSGLGKTTLLRTLAGLVDPLGGTLRLKGETPGDLGWPRYRGRVVLVAQTPLLFEGSVEDNLRRPFLFRASDGAFDAERAAALLDRLGLDATLLAEDAATLSVGQKQRVCLVRALLLAPKVLLLDEPTSALDQKNRKRVEEHLRHVEAACVVVTHDPGVAARLDARRLDLVPLAASPPETAT